MMKVVTIIQARTSSQRLPNKVLMDVDGRSLLDRVIDQCLQISDSTSMWVATSNNPEDDGIQFVCERRGVHCFRGSLDDVRSRFHSIALQEQADVIVRATADNPLVEPSYADQMIAYLKEHTDCDYVRMSHDVIPYGSGCEVFTFNAFRWAVQEHDTPENKEHVTPALIRHSRMVERHPSDLGMVTRRRCNVTVDTTQQYLDMVRLFRTHGQENLLRKIICKVNDERPLR
jgi:spore coat polysaccharide biosynthesis protein SpsF (cytidylyltransferase family)